MLSRIIPLEYLKERDVMFWLPPGGQDNDVWADTWVIIAELDAADAQPVLDLLQDNDIGGYVAKPGGLRGAQAPGRQLYVDREQYTKAIDVLMLFLRQKDQPPMPRAKRIVPKVDKVKIPRPVVLALKIAVVAALIALFLLLVYAKGSQMWARVHPVQQPAPASNVPGMTNPTWSNPRP